MKRILITSIDPLLVDYRPPSSNEHDTLHYIPASRLRGAFFEARKRLGIADSEIDRLVGFNNTLWTAAYPAYHVHPDAWFAAIPFPLCPVESGDSKSKPRGFAMFDNGSLMPQPVDTEIEMRVARDYQRHAHRDEALYARAAIAPEQKFVAFVKGASALKDDVYKFEWNLGTRHSVNGACQIEIESGPSDLSGIFQGAATTRDDGLLVVQLMSDAILPGANGGYLRGLDSNEFTKLVGSAASVEASYSSWKVVSGWSGRWKLPREAAIAIERGSVWLLKIADETKRTAFADRLKAANLGIRGYEGFGIAVTDPPWIVVKPENKLDVSGRLFFRYKEPESVVSIPEILVSAAEIDRARSAREKAGNCSQARLAETIAETRKWASTVAKADDLGQLKALAKFLGPDWRGQSATTSANRSNEIENTDRLPVLHFLRAYETGLKRIASTLQVGNPAEGPMEIES